MGEVTVIAPPPRLPPCTSQKNPDARELLRTKRGIFGSCELKIVLLMVRHKQQNRLRIVVWWTTPSEDALHVGKGLSLLPTDPFRFQYNSMSVLHLESILRQSPIPEFTSHRSSHQFLQGKESWPL